LIEGTSGDSTLDTAWRLLTMRLEERADPDMDFDVYLEQEYGVNFGSLYAFYDSMMNGEQMDDENAVSMFVVAFEFGKLHERYINDMAKLGG
jgi:hypothetical protein